MIKKFWWTATTIQVVGVLCLTSRVIDPCDCFVILLAGSFVGVLISDLDKNRPLLVLNAVFFVSNLIGIVQWWKA